MFVIRFDALFAIVINNVVFVLFLRESVPWGWSAANLAVFSAVKKVCMLLIFFLFSLH